MIERVIEVLAIASRRWWIFILPPLLTIPIAYAMVKIAPAKYVSNSIILLRSASNNSAFGGASATVPRHYMIEQIQAIEAWLKSDHVLMELLPQLQGEPLPDDKEDLFFDLLKLRKSLELELLGNSVLEIRLSGGEAKGLGRKLEVIVARLMEGLVQPDAGILSASQLMLLRRSDAVTNTEQALNSAIRAAGFQQPSDVRKQLKRLHELTRKEIGTVTATSQSGVKREIQSIRSALAVDQATVRQLERHYQSNDDARRAYFVLSNSDKAGRNNYVGLLDAPENLRIIGRPRDPLIGSKSARKIAIAAIFLSLLVGGALAILVEVLSNRVRLRADFEELSGLPVIGRLPRLETTSSPGG